MPFIGNAPARVPLTSADIADGIITSAKIVDGTIVNADINASSAITLNKLSGNPNFRNRIINGDMQIDQRNNGAAVTVNSYATFFSVDRFKFIGQDTDGVFTAQRSATAPTGFVNSLLITVTTADSSLTSSQEYTVRQDIEGYNIADLGFGTANAKTITLSFWVRSSVTGAFGGSFLNNGGSRTNPFSYTISSANTWEYKTITIAGDTSGTWETTTSTGLSVMWSLGVGTGLKGTAGTWSGSTFYAPTSSVNLISTSGATLYITGVQLEAGTSATDFEFLPIDVDLARCRRYYAKIVTDSAYTAIGSGFIGATTSGPAYIKYPESMRASPTVTQSGLAIHHNAYNLNAITAINGGDLGKDSALVQFAVASGLTVGQAMVIIGNNNVNAYVDFSIEL